MPKKPKPDPLAEIERNQEQLRENIEESIHLVEKTQELLERMKQDQTGGSEAGA